MNYSLILLKQVVIMFIIICTGILCYKKNIITKEAGKYLSGFVLNIVTPSFIFMSYQSEFSKDSLVKLLQAFLLAFLSHILMIALSYIFIRKKEQREYSIERFSTVYTNCGYMGIPLIQGVFGTEGVLLATAYVTIFNIFTWTHGIMTIRNSFSPKDILNALRSPTLISIVLGLICYVSGIRIPDIAAQPLNYIGSMNTPLAMIVAGLTIAQTNLLKTLKNARVLLITVLRLAIFPMIIIPIISLIPCDKTVFMSIMLSVSCPSAAIGTLFAVQYDKNAVYASEIFAVATVLSSVSMPLMLLYINLFK